MPLDITVLQLPPSAPRATCSDGQVTGPVSAAGAHAMHLQSNYSGSNGGTCNGFATIKLSEEFKQEAVCIALTSGLLRERVVSLPVPLAGRET